MQPSYGYAPSVAYAEPSYAPVRVAYAEPSYDEAPVYAFNYAVADDYSGANFQVNFKKLYIFSLIFEALQSVYKISHVTS